MSSNADAEAMAKIGLDMSDFKAATVEGGEYMGKLGGKIAGELTEIRKVGNVMAAALGLDLKSIAENVARFVTGMSKEEEESYKRVAALSDQATELATKNMRARLTEEQKYALALTERDALMQKLAEADLSTGRGMEENLKTRIALETKLGEIIAYEAKVREAANKKFIADTTEANRTDLEVRTKNLEASQRIQVLTQEIADAEQFITLQKKAGADTTILEAGLKDRQKALGEAQLAIEKEQLQFREKITKEFASYAEKYDKLKFEQMTTEQKLVVLYEQQAGWQHTMDLYAESTNEYKRAYVEHAAVAKQITELEAEAQGRITGEIKAQVEAKARFSAIGRTGSNYESQSTAALEGIYSKLTSQLDPAGLGLTADPYAAGLNTAIQAEMQTVAGILAQRREVGSYIGRFGEEKARYQYGDAVVQSTLSSQSNTLNKIASGVADMNQRLSGAGLSLNNGVYIGNGATTYQTTGLR